MNWKVSSVGISVIYHSRLCWNSDSERSNDILRWRGALWFSTAILMFSPTESDTADFLNTAFPIMNYDTARLVGQIAFLPCLGNLMSIILVWIQARLPRYLPKQSKHAWYQNKRSKQARCEKALNGWFFVRICCSVDQTLSKVHACEGNVTQSSGIYSETDAKDRNRGYLSKPVHRILFMPCLCQQQNWTSKENEIGLACFQCSNQFRLP